MAFDPSKAARTLMRHLAQLVAGSFPVVEGETLEEYAARVVASDLNKSQRAMIAAYLYDASKREVAERRLDKEAWIATARLLFEPGERQVCWVCGKFQSITQAHHVIPLAAQYSRGFPVPDHEHVWLCPNHHTIVHMFIQDDRRSMALRAMRARQRTVAALNNDLSEGEFDKLLDLMTRAGRAPA